MTKEPLCFEQDEDGHWYLIMVSEKKLFDELLYEEDDDCEKFNERFGNKMLPMNITCYCFVDCKEIK